MHEVIAAGRGNGIYSRSPRAKPNCKKLGYLGFRRHRSVGELLEKVDTLLWAAFKEVK